MTLFDNIADHDPGGKVKLRLRAGITGTASFSPCRKYRHLLTRSWGVGQHVLWIGANPSTAEASFDDPTIGREVDFTARWGFFKYVKCNVMDYRATYPRDLLAPGLLPRSAQNLSTILSVAKDAAVIVVCFGVLHPRLRLYGEEAEAALIQAGHELWCLGLTNGGMPRHPLYVSKATALRRYLEP